MSKASIAAPKQSELETETKKLKKKSSNALGEITKSQDTIKNTAVK